MSDHVKEILTEIGYTLRDCGREYRTKPLYRDSDNHNVLCIKKTNGVWIDFKTNKCGNLEELVKLTLNLKDLEEAKDYVQNKAPAEGRVREKEKLKSKVIFYQKLLHTFLSSFQLILFFFVLFLKTFLI